MNGMRGRGGGAKLGRMIETVAVEAGWLGSNCGWGGVQGWEAITAALVASHPCGRIVERDWECRGAWWVGERVRVVHVVVRIGVNGMGAMEARVSGGMRVVARICVWVRGTRSCGRNW